MIPITFPFRQVTLKEHPQAASGYVRIWEKAVIGITGGRDGSRKTGKEGNGRSVGDVAVVARYRGLFSESLPFDNSPPPFWRSIGITDLEEIRDLIYGLQSLRGKILSRKELQPQIGSRYQGQVSSIEISRSRSDEHTDAVEYRSPEKAVEEDRGAMSALLEM